MSKDTEQTVLKEVLNMSSRLGNIESTLETHSLTLIRMESKMNSDIERFNKTAGELKDTQRNFDDRLKPLEDAERKRSEFTSEVKKKSWDTVWDWAKVGIVFLAGYLLTIIRK